MISIKSEREIELLKVAGQIVGDTHKYLIPFIKPGITTKELDNLAHKYIISRGATHSFLGYEGYPGSICTSVNEEVVHGIPGDRTLKEGDIVSLDIGVVIDGYHSDSAWNCGSDGCSDSDSGCCSGSDSGCYSGSDSGSGTCP